MIKKLNILLQELVIEEKTHEAIELANILYDTDCVDNIIYNILCNEILLTYLFNYKDNQYFYIDYLGIKFEVGKGYSIKDVEEYFDKSKIWNYEIFNKREKIKAIKILEKNIVLINS